MGISIKDWFKYHFGKSTPAEMEALYADPDNVCALANAAKEMALLTCTNIITATLGRCEFVTYNEGDAVKRNEWRLWNVQPNQNQSAQQFRAQLIHTLVGKGEALVIELESGIYVADSFTASDDVVKERLYTDIAVGSLTLNRKFKEHEVMHFALPDSAWMKTFDSLAQAYASVINSGVKGYRRAQGMKGTLSIDAMQMSTNEKMQKAYEALKNAAFKQFADAESAVLPLYKGMEYTDTTQKTYSNQNSRDIRAMVDDLTDFAARMLGIPPVLVNGSVQDTASARRQLVSDCIIPLAKILDCEISRKRYTAGDIERGTLLEVDTSRAIYVDWLTAAQGIDKLIASGAASVNDVRGLLGLPLIDEEWANRHYLTKNYGDIENPGEEVIQDNE